MDCRTLSIIVPTNNRTGGATVIALQEEIEFWEGRRDKCLSHRKNNGKFTKNNLDAYKSILARLVVLRLLLKEAINIKNKINIQERI